VFKVQSGDQLRGQPVFGGDERRIGVVRLVDCADGDPYTPRWALVTLGPGRLRRRLMPLAKASWHPRGIAVPYCQKLVAATPAATPRDLRNPQICAEIARLYRLGAGG
jgi:hypothetical protein